MGGKKVALKRKEIELNQKKGENLFLHLMSNFSCKGIIMKKEVHIFDSGEKKTHPTASS